MTPRSVSRLVLCSAARPEPGRTSYPVMELLLKADTVSAVMDLVRIFRVASHAGREEVSLC